MAYTAFAIPFSTLGINNVIVKEIIDNPDEEGMVLGSGIGIRFIASVFAIILLAGVVYILNPTNLELRVVSFIYSFVLLFRTVDLIEYWYQSKLLSKVAAKIGMTAYIITSVFRLVLLICNASIYYFSFAYVIDLIVVAALLLIHYWSDGNTKLSFSKSSAKVLLNKSYHYILSSMMVMIYAQMDKIMIGGMENEKSVGLYSVAVAICQLWTFVLQAIIDSARPTIIAVRNQSKELYEKRIKQLYSLVIWMSLTVSLMICIFSTYIVEILYGSEYNGAEGPLRIVTWYTCFSYLGVARNIWSVCENMQKYEKYFALTGAVSNTILNFVLIPLMGINGAALASLLTQIITNVIVPYCIKDTRSNALYVIKAFNVKCIMGMLEDLLGEDKDDNYENTI